MEKIGSVVVFCIWLGALTVCTILVISGILRWMADAEERDKRLNTAAWIAVVVLFIMLLVHCRGDLIDLFGIGGSSSQLTAVIVNVSKITAKLLILGAVLACVVLLLLFVFQFVRYGLNTIVKAKPNTANSLVKDLAAKSDEFFAIMKTPILMMAITFGLLATFGIIPFFMGGQDSLEQSLYDIWKDGIQQIVVFADSKDGDRETGLDETAVSRPESVAASASEGASGEVGGDDSDSDNDLSPDGFSSDLITYILVFMVILGIGFIATQTLYSILKDYCTKKDPRGIIAEHSDAIGTLSIGISILWSLWKGALRSGSIFKTIVIFGKSFLITIGVITLVDLALETVRLIMDMKDKLIRLELQCLFVSLAGLSTILLMSLLITIYDAVNAVIGNSVSADMDRLQEKMKCRIIEGMEGQMEKKNDYKTTFSGFSEKITKK